MKTVILAGGKGLRYNSDKPKVLSLIGDIPIIHHVMNIYSIQGYNDFILALGYKKDAIIDYFNNIDHSFHIKFVDTGEESSTCKRISEIKNYIPRKSKFFCTYADGISNVNLSKLLSTHNKSSNIATLTAVKTNHIYGTLELSRFSSRIKHFKEKSQMKEWINGGFFVFSYNIFYYIQENDKSLETDVFERLVLHKKMGSYKHNGFWDTINTVKDQIKLNDVYKKSTLPEWYNIKQ